MGSGRRRILRGEESSHALPFSRNNFVIIAYLFENYLLADETVLGANPWQLLTQWAASGSGSGRCAAAPEGGRVYKVC